VLPNAVTFEWAGSDRVKYHVRLLGPQGAVLWEQAAVERKPFAYPSSAPRLTPGTRYTWELSTKEYSPLRESFEVAPAPGIERVTDALSVLTPATAGNYPPETLALMRAGLFLQETFYADARRELVRAIAASPEEPTLHFLLGHVYDRTGLKQLASEEFDEAEALAVPR
jgi:3',5'-cyclic AMP phosphodiesterase CpdA